jgi:hypothetical protein
MGQSWEGISARKRVPTAGGQSPRVEYASGEMRVPLGVCGGASKGNA